ncbi:MAG: hypothetical protein ABIQ30_13935 [Devosia sp.]
MSDDRDKTRSIDPNLGKFVALNVSAGPLVGLLGVIVWLSLAGPARSPMPPGYGHNGSVDLVNVLGSLIFLAMAAYVFGFLPAIGHGLLAALARRFVRSDGVFVLMVSPLSGFSVTVAFAIALKAVTYRSRPGEPPLFPAAWQDVLFFGLVGALAALVCGLAAAYLRILPRPRG